LIIIYGKPESILPLDNEDSPVADDLDLIPSFSILFGSVEHAVYVFDQVGHQNGSSSIIAEERFHPESALPG
jgi:hypothetical protein